MKDPARAFAFLTAMACVDNDFRDIEQMGLRALCERFATLYAKTVVASNPNPCDD